MFLSVILIADIDFDSQCPLCVTMAPAGNTDARYSTFNKSQRDMHVVNTNINIQGRSGKSSSEVAELTLIALQLRRTFFFLLRKHNDSI